MWLLWQSHQFLLILQVYSKSLLREVFHKHSYRPTASSSSPALGKDGVSDTFLPLWLMVRH